MKKIGLFMVMAIFAVMTSFADEMTSFMNIPLSATKSEAKQILADNGFKVKDERKYRCLSCKKTNLTYANKKVERESIKVFYTDSEKIRLITLSIDSYQWKSISEMESVMEAIAKKYGLKLLEKKENKNRELDGIVWTTYTYSDNKNVAVSFIVTHYWSVIDGYDMASLKIECYTYEAYQDSKKKQEEAKKKKEQAMNDDI